MASDNPTNADSKTPSFEQSLARLEEIVEELEDGNLDLTESLACYEEGVGSLRQCYELLEKAEGRIEVLSSFDEKGKPITTPLEETGSTLEEKASSRNTRRTAGRKTRKSTTRPAVKDPSKEDDDIGAPGSLF